MAGGGGGIVVPSTSNVFSVMLGDLGRTEKLPFLQPEVLCVASLGIAIARIGTNDPSMVGMEGIVSSNLTAAKDER